MTYSYTQISQYLRCPRSYRYRYLDGWQEKETRASMVFGRCFENALAAYFRREDCGKSIAMRCLTTKKEKPGIACCTRESICSKYLRGTIASVFMIRTTIFKSRKSDDLVWGASSSLIWTPSVKLTA